MIHCSYPECDKTIKNNAWVKTRSGWFFAKEGKAFCTNHLPSWYKEWRRKRGFA